MDDDWYGTRIADWKKYAEQNEMKYLCRAAWTVKPEYAHIPIKQLKEHMVDLYFPEKLTFRSLMLKCRHNEKNFRCQQLNEPAGGDLACDFDETTIAAHTIIVNRVPRPANGAPRKVAIVWDTAHDNKVASDYSAGAVGYCHEETRTLYVLEVAAGKWKDSETAVRLVDLHWKWDAMFSEVERFAGWELFAQEVQRVSMGKYRKYLPLVWRTPNQESGAKRNRVKGLETLLSADRLWFVDGEWMDMLTQQFTRFTGFSRKRKDDIPDAIAGLQRLIPAQRAPEDEANRETEAQRLARVTSVGVLWSALFSTACVEERSSLTCSQGRFHLRPGHHLEFNQ